MTRITKEPEQRRLEIVEAARRLFETKGYSDTSMQDLLASLGIAKGTIYHYFKSKEQLFEAVIERIVDDSLAPMVLVLEKSRGNALERFRAFAQAANVSSANQELLHQLHRPENAAIHVRMLALAISKQAPLFAAVIEQGCKEGHFNTRYPLEAAELILASVQFLTDVGIYAWSAETLQRRRQAMSSLIEKQLGAREGVLDGILEV